MDLIHIETLWRQVNGIFSKLEVCVQRSINEVEGGCLNMCLVYWAALVNMGSMLTGDMKTRQHLWHFVSI